MDQTKIGKLIAKLRKEKGMTQRELGDKVGVGFKAVSKWERGITCPDISIINELSKILGITSDELLTGKLNKEHQPSHKINKKILLIIPILILIPIIILCISKINNNHSNVYNLDSLNDEYYIEGKIIFIQNNMEIYINKIKFIDKNCKNTIIKNYEYTITNGNDTILSYGYISLMQEIPSKMPISEFSNSFKINYTINNISNKDKIISNGLTLKIIFLDDNENLIEKSIPMTLNRYQK